MNILYIQASPRGAKSVSNSFANKAVLALQERFEGATVTTLDLNHQPPNFIDQRWFDWNYGDKSTMSAEDHAYMTANQAYSDQILAADYIVIATPMYNLTVPAVLKAWIDHVVIGGKTFKYVDGMPVGLVKNVKQLIFVASNSGDMDKLAGFGMDYLRPYMKSVMGYIGIQNLSSFAFSGRMQDLNTATELAMKDQIAGLL